MTAPGERFLETIRGEMTMTEPRKIDQLQALTRRQAAFGVAALALAPEAVPAEPAVGDPLETYIRMRASLDGRISFAWLDAIREVVIDGEITPFCRFLAGVVQTARRVSADMFELRVVEVTFYLDPTTGALLDRVRMPGTEQMVTVPLYRAGPTNVRVAKSLDEWERNDPAEAGAASQAFAPKGEAHLVRGVGSLVQNGAYGFLRADEYGRLYRQKGAPPSVFYREWMIWRAALGDIASGEPSIPSDFSYTALSSWRPWMNMGAIKGHTAENGHGAKSASIEAWPQDLITLVRAHQPDVLKDPRVLLKL